MIWQDRIIELRGKATPEEWLRVAELEATRGIAEQFERVADALERIADSTSRKQVQEER